MPDEDIRFKHISPLSSQITAGDVTYVIETGKKDSLTICSRVSSKGKVLFSKDADFSHLKGLDNFQDRLDNFMAQLQRSVIEQFSETLKLSRKKKSEYVSEARSLLKNGNDEEAFRLVKEGMRVFQDDPILLSYYGLLYSLVEEKHGEGVKICRYAISLFDEQAPANRELLYPILYLNLGRAYIRAGKKKEAFRAFRLGLKSDAENADIIAEIEKFGKRKKPIIPFLERSNFLNRCLGMFLSKIGILRR